MILFYLVTDSSFAVTITELKPLHSRPFLLQESEKKRILNLIENQAWASQEFQNLQQKAEQKDGYSAALMYALTNKSNYLEIAKQWLLNFTKSGADIGQRALNVEDSFFNQGMPWLGDVFYRTNTEYLEAYDFIYNGLSETERQSILKGINASADFRLRAMDAWWQTANLVFKPTSMVAIAGLVTQNPKHLEWGFLRKPDSHLGGYFSALNNMLRDNGPWYEAPIYAIAHLPLQQSLKVSDFLTRMTGKDWFNRKLDQGSSVKGLMDYYIDTTYPAELRPDGTRDYRILTFGDGATGQHGDFYLTSHNPLQRNLINELALSYKLSQDPDYAAFLNLTPNYQPKFFDKPQLPLSPLLPKAQSSIWPEFGLAFLRSDNSRNYWTNPNAMATSLLFRQGYGHGHADALSITLFAAGQLFYPDYNAVQYENPAIGWTTSSVAHNTVVADGNNSLIPKNVRTKHEFKDDFRFIQADVNEPLGLSKKRTLALTSDYLLDVFRLKSLVPRTYDYLLHSFGRIEKIDPTQFNSGPAFSTRYKNIKNFQTSVDNDAWQVDFIIDAQRKQQNINQLINKFIDENNSQAKLLQEFGGINLDSFRSAKLNFKMGGHPDTSIGLGEDQYGLSFLAARRENLKQTTFTTLHSPSHLDQQQSNVNDIEILFESNQGVLVKVISNEHTDLHAISHSEGRTNLYDQANKTGIKFKDYAVIRINNKSKQVTSHGEYDAYSIAANIAGTQNDLVDGDYMKTPTDSKSMTEPVQTNIFPELVVLKDFADSSFSLSLTNTTEKSISAKIELQTDHAYEIPQTTYLLDQIPAHQTSSQEIKLGRYKNTKPLDILPITVSINNSNQVIEDGIMVSAGPGLIRQFEHLDEPVYRIHTFDSTFDFSMRHGFISQVSDKNTLIIFDNDSLFDLSDGETIFSPKLNTIDQSYTWADQNNTSVISEINNKIRWHTLVIQNRFYFRLDNVYTRLDEVFFVFDKNNRNFNWQNAVFLKDDESASFNDSNPVELITHAIEIPFSNSEKSLCIKTTNVKTWLNTDKSLSFSLTRDTNDQFGLGICNSESLANWAR